MKYLKIMLLVLLVLCVLPVTALGSQQLPVQPGHKVTLTQLGSRQANGSDIYWWDIQTVQDAVDAELNGIAKAYLDEVSPMVKKPAKDATSRLDVSIRHSRTGINWLSFMVQSRYVHNGNTMDVRFTTRTYDMETGARLMLTDIFPEGSEAWPMLESAVREGINRYFGAQQPDAAALEAACTREAIQQMDFTLHGMSLVLHLHAGDFYPGKQQLIEVTLYYPDIRPMMTAKAQYETDNLTYYNTIALTYDDGPNGWVTRDMLNVLLEKGERATFFVVGNRMNRYASYVLREHDEGHTVATHNYDHVIANEVKESKLISLAQKARDIHRETIGIEPTIARAPGGVWKPMANAALGWPLIQWSSQGTDWEGPQGRDPKAVLAQVLSGVEDGAIILMHDMKKNSITSSEMIIDRLQGDGYIFLTVEELFAKDGVVLQPDAAYWRCQDGVTTDN